MPQRRSGLWLAAAIGHGFFAVFFVFVAVTRLDLGESWWRVVGALGIAALFGFWAVQSVAKYRGRPRATAGREDRERL